MARPIRSARETANLLSAFCLSPFAVAAQRQHRLAVSSLRSLGLLAGTLCAIQASPAGAVEIPFGESNIAANADGAISVHAADMDGDGDVDIVAASLNDNVVSWFENNGPGNLSFTRRTVGATRIQPDSVRAADMDGDGDMDVLVGSLNDNTLAWYENNGAANPSFTLNTFSNGSYSTRAVYAADLDGDGDMDALSASLLDGVVAWHENDGLANPAFTQRTITSSGANATSVHVADVDGDGDLDVVSTEAYYATFSAVYWHENDGAANPTFTSRTISTQSVSIQSAFATDIDGDGDVDVVSASSIDDKIAWYENNGAATPVFTLRTVSLSADGATSVYAIDMDGDGDIDLASASALDNKLAWYENDGATPPSFTTRTVSLNASYARAVFAIDLDSDGDVDLLSASSDDDSITWYPNQSIHGSAAFPQKRTVSTQANGAMSTFAADLDNDGDLDLLGASAVGDEIAWYENGGQLNAAFTRRIISTSADLARSVHAADLDADGDLDVVSASSNDDKVAWYENDGAANPSFTLRTISLLIDGASSVTTADVDGDGDLDVLASAADSNSIYWLESNGAANPLFTRRTIVANAAISAQSVASADVDGDGDIDVLSASRSDNKIAWYENDGAANPSFVLRTISTSEQYASAVAAADMDGDGDIDALSAAYIGGKIAWHENNGAADPAFISRTVSLATAGASDVRAMDLDADGDMDILAAAAYDSKVVWFENDGAANPSFALRTISLDTPGVRSAIAADLDNDGDLDVAAASFANDRINWFPNRGGQFGLPTFDLAPGAASAGDRDVPVLRIDAHHLGRAGDASLELSSFKVRFVSGFGIGLGNSAANALVDRLFVYRDDGDSAFDPESDPIISTIANLDLNNGVQEVSFLSGDANVEVSSGNTQSYFLAVDIADGADQQTPNNFRIIHTPFSLDASEDTPLSSARDAVAGTPLKLERFISVSSATITAAPDTTPDPFDFFDRTDRPTAARISSNTITLSGLAAAAPISVDAVGSSEEYSINGGAFTGAAGTVENGDTVRVRVISPAAPNVTRSVDVNIGGLIETWNVTTGSVDETPASFDFTDVPNASPQGFILSETLTLTNFNAPTSIVIRGANSARYSINSGPFTNAAGTVSPGDTIRLRMLSSANPGATRRAYVTIGRLRTVWSVTTAP